MLRPYATSIWDMSGRGCPPTPDGAGEGLSLCQAEKGKVTHQAGALQQERLSRREKGDMEATWCLLIEREPRYYSLKMGIFGVCPSQR